MADFAPAYLVHGDDQAKLDAWRARLHARAGGAAGEGGEVGGSLELFDGRTAGPEQVAQALVSLTFGEGERYLLADHADAWRAGDLEPLEGALAAPAPETVLVLIVRGKKPSQRLAKAVEGAGGEVRAYAAPKPWELPKWAAARARERGLELDPEAAKALVATVGPHQQRLERELEKLALAVHPGRRAGAAEVEELASGEVPPGVYELADAVAARDLRAALALTERLRGQDERPARLLYPIVRRLREIHRAARLLDAGTPEQGVAREMKLPPWLAKRVLARARGADREALEDALCAFADLELTLRGADEGRLDEDSALSLALAQASA